LKIRREISVLLAVCIIFIACPMVSNAEEDGVQLSNLSLQSENFVCPQENLAAYATQGLSIGNSTSLDYSLVLSSNGMGVISGYVNISANRSAFYVEGKVNEVQGEEGRLLFADMYGYCGNEPATLTMAKDYGTDKTQIVISIGRLSATSVPQELIFGELSTACSDYYAESSLTSCDADERIESPQPRIATDDVVFVATDYGFLPNGNKCIALSLYAPETAVRNTNIRIGAKVTTNSSNVLAYLRTVDSTARSLNIGYVNFETGSLTNNDFIMGTAYPEPTTSSIELLLPYLNVVSQSIGWFTVTYTLQSITKTLTPASNPHLVAQKFYYASTDYPVWSQYDWGSALPEAARTGLAINDYFTYSGSVSGGTVTVPYGTTAESVLGYYTVLANGRTQYHTIVMDSLSVSDTIRIRDAA
jgi:hypothetical protein